MKIRSFEWTPNIVWHNFSRILTLNMVNVLAEISGMDDFNKFSRCFPYVLWRFGTWICTWFFINLRDSRTFLRERTPCVNLQILIAKVSICFHPVGHEIITHTLSRPPTNERALFHKPVLKSCQSRVHLGTGYYIIACHSRYTLTKLYTHLTRI